MNYMSEMEFVEIVEAVCKRPKMYTPGGSMNEAISFLEGFAIGANVGNSNAHSKFSPFYDWLTEKTGARDKARAWRIVMQEVPDEKGQLRELLRLYREYAETVCNPMRQGVESTDRERE